MSKFRSFFLVNRDSTTEPKCTKQIPDQKGMHTKNRTREKRRRGFGVFLPAPRIYQAVQHLSGA